MDISQWLSNSVMQQEMPFALYVGLWHSTVCNLGLFCQIQTLYIYMQS